jgi:O-antigen/teichoic acid export membrane protein
LLASLAWLRPHALPLSWAWNFGKVRRLIAIGGPLLLAGIASSLFRSLDKIMVLAFLADGEHQLGVYSIALMVCAQLYGAANMLSTAALPRYTELLGRTGDPRAVARVAARTTELHAAILSLPAALAITAGWPALAWLLPKYAAGLDALLWLVPGTLAVALALPASQYLSAMGRGGVSLAALVAAIAVGAGGSAIVLARGGGFVEVAKVMLLADVAYLAVGVALSLWPRLSAQERMRYLAAVLLVPGPALGVGMWLGASGERSIGAAAIASAAAMVVWCAVLFTGWRLAGWREAWRSANNEQASIS